MKAQNNYIVNWHNTVQCKILMGGNFDGYRLFKYLMENISTDGHCLSPYTCKCCIIVKQFDRLNFDGLAGKRQKCQSFPHQKFALYGMLMTVTILHGKVSLGENETPCSFRGTKYL